jgi:hypothetical protein
MDFDTRVKLAVYRQFAGTTLPPEIGEIARLLGASADEVRGAYARLFSRRVLVVEADGERIRMAPPFSGVPTQHQFATRDRRYYANCAWDALGIPAALPSRGTVMSRCEQSGEPLRLEVGGSGPEPSDWLFHCPIPAARWWQDIVYT